MPTKLAPPCLPGPVPQSDQRLPQSTTYHILDPRPTMIVSLKKDPDTITVAE
jgi:hypothetical protein